MSHDDTKLYKRCEFDGCECDERAVDEVMGLLLCAQHASEHSKLIEQEWADDDSDIWLDLSDLSGDSTPTTLDDFMLANEELPPDASELARLRALRIGESTRLAIGGGSVVVKRVGVGS